MNAHALLERTLHDFSALWNGNLALASKLFHARSWLHRSPLDGGCLECFAGPEHMTGWIAPLHAAFHPLHFDLDAPPLFDLDRISIRWIAHGVYRGGLPGADAAPGTPVTFAGTDVLRIQDGQIAEYWTSSDVRSRLKQLGALVY